MLVLHAAADAAFAHGVLLPALDLPDSAARALEAHTLDGEGLAALERDLAASAFALVVLTPALADDAWASEAERLAIASALRDRGKSTILIELAQVARTLHQDAAIRLDFTDRSQWLGQIARLRRDLARGAREAPRAPCPFPGMRAFDEAEASWFYGRTEETAAVIAAIASGERAVYVIGPSGSGKSSLLRAGVVPTLRERRTDVRWMRPGDAPRARLAECLEIAGALTPETVKAWRARLSAPPTIIIDQLEELFAVADLAAQLAFASAIADLRTASDAIVVFALRADFYAALMQSRLWIDGPRHHVDLPALRGARLRAVIEQPARAVGVYFEPGLVEQLLGDAADEPGALPLLQATLVELWDKLCYRLLTRADYTALARDGSSGLAVATATWADRWCAAQTPAEIVIARRVLLRLVSFGEGRPNTRRRQTRAQLVAGDDDAARVLARLATARLVIPDGDGEATSRIDLCHEALLTAWPTLAGWVSTRREHELQRRRLQALADEWMARGRGATGLLDAGELAAALAWRATEAAREVGESPEAAALVDESRTALARGRTRTRRWTVALCAVFVALAAFAETRRRIAETERSRAERERAQVVAAAVRQARETGAQLLRDHHPLQAVPYLAVARTRGDDAALRAMFRQATAVTSVARWQHAAPVAAIALSGDGRVAVSADLAGSVQLHDTRGGAAIGAPLHGDRSLRGVALDHSGRRLLVTEDQAASLWELDASPPVRHALRHEHRLVSAAFAGDGRRVLTASEDGCVRLWSAETGERIAGSLAAAGPLNTAALSPDGDAVAVSPVLQGAGIFDAASGARRVALTNRGDDAPRPDPLKPRDGSDVIYAAWFSPDGQTIATVAADRTLAVSDARTGRKLAPPIAHAREIVGVAFVGGDQVATWSTDGALRVFDIRTGAAAGPPLAHASALRDAQLTPDGRRAITLAADLVARVWSIADRRMIGALELEAPIAAAALTPEGDRVVTAATDGAVQVWTIEDRGPRAFATAGAPVSAAFAADDRGIVTVDEHGELSAWSPAGAQLRRERTRIPFGEVAVSPRGDWIAVTDRGGVVALGQAGGGLRGIRPGPGESSVRGELPPAGPFFSRGGFSPDGTRYVTTVDSHAARIWSCASLRPVSPPLRHAALVSTARFMPDGARVLTASRNGTARLWDAATGAPLGVLGRPGEPAVVAAEASPDGRWIVTAREDREVQLWDAATLRPRFTLGGHAGAIQALAFSADATRLVTSSAEGFARIWEVATGRLVRELRHAAPVRSAAFAPDGERVVTITADRAQLWDAVTGAALGAPLEHAAGLRQAVWSRDGAMLLTVAADGVWRWDVGLDQRTAAVWWDEATAGAFPALARALARELAPAR